MKSTFVLAQLEAMPDYRDNIAKAEKAIKESVERFRADFIVFPEVFMYHYPRGTEQTVALGSAQPLDGPFVQAMQQLARQYKVWIVVGMREVTGDGADSRNYNTTLMLDSEGTIKGVYRKTHLYDAFGIKESKTMKPGDKLFDPIDTPFGRIGMFVCYEVRFPEVARDQALKGADIIVMPTAWVKGDLKSLHFRTLVTARAIENTVFMLACDQYSKMFMGESVAVDPMGVPMASGGEGECLVPVFVDTDRIAEVRKKLPSFKDRRVEVYGGSEK